MYDELSEILPGLLNPSNENCALVSGLPGILAVTRRTNQLLAPICSLAKTISVWLWV